MRFRNLYVALLVVGAAVLVAGDASADGPQSGGRVGGSMWGRRGPQDFAATKDDAEKEGWVEVAKDVLSRIETPGITWNLKPERTHLKFRKVFYPLGITKLSVGADFNPVDASWRVHTSWRDQIIGGDLQLQGSEISITKDFPVDDRTALWLKAAFDWRTQKSMLGFKIRPGKGLSARLMRDDGPALNFRNEVPLNQHISVEIDGTLELPEAAYTTQHGGRMCLGLGDFKVDMNEVNIVAQI